MRYDYAWKDAEFRDCSDRTMGVACRLLYTFGSWMIALAEKKQKTQQKPWAHWFVEANGYPVFADSIMRACSAMDCQLATDKASAHLVFAYIAPPGEERVDGSQFATFTDVMQSWTDRNEDPDTLPLFCFLIGEAAFLDVPKDAERERLRGLSDFATSQQLTPIMDQGDYTSIAHYAVEFVPAVSVSNEFQQEKDARLQGLMGSFGCLDRNLMHHTEKWQFFAPTAALLHKHEDELTHPSEDEARYWLEYARGKVCDECHQAHEKLLRCARCANALYCSRDCQKAAWKLHKRFCGQPSEQASTS
ncbi:TPA: hypothetical protein N0F65_001248 [Lagenidium giganteum]|uniref:MYND-type domain-containing protein n=1 Tax=Lagenidium giganteum TaxID=4803 RepID=A0AAV2YWV8_9STRA|nr:TPA: hypothetical protein N0F65_001248 [Lagenidium giganteum]